MFTLLTKRESILVFFLWARKFLVLGFFLEATNDGTYFAIDFWYDEEILFLEKAIFQMFEH